MATYLNFPFDEEIFYYQWQQKRDMVLTEFLNSGGIAEDAAIASLIANGSDTYTVPMYNLLGGTPENYDGATNITATQLTGASESGIVFGRAHAFKEIEFVRDYNSGADPMGAIAAQVGKWWDHYRQNTVISMLGAVMGVSAISSHVINTAAVPDATCFGDAAQEALGDAAQQLSIAIMHSKVANQLAGLDLLNFRKYTDELGVQRELRVADFNGMTVIVDDSMPSVTADSTTTYTTYLMAPGAIRHAAAPVTTPVEVTRNALTNGGENLLVTRIRETYHPEGFSYTKPGSGYTASPTDAQLTATARWSLVADPKAVGIVAVKTTA